MSDLQGGKIMNDTLIKYDKIEDVANGTIIQHGKLNDRIYLMKLNSDDVAEALLMINSLAREEQYSKIICKIPKKNAPVFYANGFLLEAFIPKFYNDTEDVFFVSKYLSSDRILNIEKDSLNDLSGILNKEKSCKVKDKPGFNFRILNESDVDAIAKIYSTVFETYPFPIQERGYVLKTMKDNVIYFGAFKDGKLAAVASSEIDYKSKNAEMTDFATYSEFSGNRLAVSLLKRMESEMKNIGIGTLYTIARLKSIPMNLTFIRMGYQYSGTLIKNTNISGDIESMNVYYKLL